MRPGPRVSILITAYNQAAFIGDAIRSALSQTFHDLEVIVADDGSTDGTQETISRLAEEDSRIVPVLSETNQGLSANWNNGVAACSGEYIALLSGDDLMFPEKIGEQLDYLDRHPQFGLCTHEMEVFDSETGKTLYRTSERFSVKEGGVEVAFRTNWLFRAQPKTIPSSTLARSAFLTAHRFDERLRYWNEWLHMIECLAETGEKWGHLPNCLGAYRRHAQQITASADAQALSFEEAMLTLAIASVRYPQLDKLIRNKREFMLFEHLVRDWHLAEKRKHYSAQFRHEAGLLKWLYMKLAHFALHSPAIVAATRPVRALLRGSSASAGK